MKLDGDTTPYRIGWRTRSHFTAWYKRWHRPWQAESQACRFARRALTPRGAVRKMARDDRLERSGRRSAYQRMRRWLARSWEWLDALFVGGSTVWKMSEAAAQLVAEARVRGKWTHMGRVNSLRRIEHAAAIGCDSADGTSYVRYTDRWLPGALVAVSAPPQLRLGSGTR